MSPQSEAPRSETALVRLALALGADQVGGSFSRAEAAIIRSTRLEEAPSTGAVKAVRESIRRGEDPLGDYLCRLRPRNMRRRAGAVYTPKQLIEPMLDWIFERKPSRLVDPGCGSGRYGAAAVARKHNLNVVAIDSDPMATMLTRAALAAMGARNASVINADFITLKLPHINGRTAYVGNPPYVRHHRLKPAVKEWLIETGAAFKQPNISTRAGLHAYFFFAAAKTSQAGDVGCFLTSSEWLDTNYGHSLRSLLLDGLGATAMHMVNPATQTFKAIDSTGLITCFEVGAAPTTIGFRQVSELSELSTLTGGALFNRELFQPENRWTRMLDVRARPIVKGYRRVRLGSVVRVRRGIATGANAFFVMTRQEAKDRGLSKWCCPVITRATEIFDGNGVVTDGDDLKVLLNVPAGIKRREHRRLNAYLMKGEREQSGEARIKDRRLCMQRDPWWHLERPDPAPIVVTYMARRPPAFALNDDRLALLNIGHYIYPLSKHLDPKVLVNELNRQRKHLAGHGRTYQGGLEKFEPGEMADLEVDLPAELFDLLATDSRT